MNKVSFFGEIILFFTVFKDSDKAKSIIKDTLLNSAGTVIPAFLLLNVFSRQSDE